MDLPRNEYSRRCARLAGKRLHRSRSQSWNSWETLESARFLDRLAVRWQHAPWCPAWLGAAHTDGCLTLQALCRAFCVPLAFLVGTALGVYLVMLLGYWVLA